MRQGHAGDLPGQYVDWQGPMRAFDACRKLGFELAFETEVWEATFR
jgi:hypothetical protein